MLHSKNNQAMKSHVTPTAVNWLHIELKKQTSTLLKAAALHLYYWKPKTKHPINSEDDRFTDYLHPLIIYCMLLSKKLLQFVLVHVLSFLLFNFLLYIFEINS